MRFLTLYSTGLVNLKARIDVACYFYIVNIVFFKLRGAFLCAQKYPKMEVLM